MEFYSYVYGSMWIDTIVQEPIWRLEGETSIMRNNPVTNTKKHRQASLHEDNHLCIIKVET